MAVSNRRIEIYIESLEAELPPLLRKIEKKALEDEVPILKKPARDLLRFQIGQLKPARILEVGAAVGFSALYMSHFIPSGGKLTTIEKVPERIAGAKRNFALAKEILEQRNVSITLLEGDAARILKELVEQKEQYDMVFMDAAKGQYMHFLPDILKLLGPSGTLISDNVLQDGMIIESRYAVTRRDRTIHLRMREYLYALTHENSLDTVILPVGDGVALTRKKSENG